MKPWVPIAAAVIVVSALVGAALYFDSAVRIGQSPNLREPQRIAAGKSIYDRHCASCHGGNLEGQPNWTSRLPNGRLQAPPHDDSGHTWHHSNEVLFALTKYGMKPPRPRDTQATCRRSHGLCPTTTSGMCSALSRAAGRLRCARATIDYSTGSSTRETVDNALRRCNPAAG